MTSKLGTIELPPDELNDVRDSIWATITTGNSESDVASYKQLVATISHPVAIIRLRAVRGTRRKQLLLNTLILWRRSCLGLYLGLIILGIALHKLSFLGVPLIFVLNLTVVNPLQTRINVELSARLAMLDRLMDEDDAIRKQVLGDSERREQDER